MVPIIIASIIGLAIIIDKLWMLLRIKMDHEKFTADLLVRVRNGQFRQAIESCTKKAHYPLPATLKVGIEKRHLPAEDIERALERAGNGQMQELERYLGGLVSIIGIEPLLGFLGTITGLIKAFMTWEKAGANITVSALAAGIYEAMITTAAGLIVAVPYFLVYNYIVSRIKYISFEMSDASMQLVEALSEAKGKEK